VCWRNGHVGWMGVAAMGTPDAGRTMDRIWERLGIAAAVRTAAAAAAWTATRSSGCSSPWSRSAR